MAQSFLNQLGKSFIRSAVNQVGRDGGKVISNQIYGNQHSTPLRIVADADTGKFEIPEGLHTKKDHSILKIICAFFLSLIPYVGGVILIYRGIVNCLRKTRKLYKTEQKTNYVQDRRYKSGARPAGITDVEVIAGEVEDVTYIKTCLAKGIIYLLIGIGSILFFIYAVYYSKNV